MEVKLPYNWEARDYQKPLLKALETGCKRAVAVWHRRAGKDLTALNWTITQMVERVGTYWHILPTYNQGRKIIFDGMTDEGRRYMDMFPPDLIARKPNETEMKVTFKNHSIWQVVGSDNYNAIVGPNPVGCVFSEYALQNPQAWDFIRPILSANDGWAIFLFTPRGHNHGYKLFNDAKLLAAENPNEWFVELLTVDHTVNVIPHERIEKDRAEGMADEMIQQEYFCSFEAPLFGSYYGKLLAQAEAEGRIGNVPYEPGVLVSTWWDLGVGDATAIWFGQAVGQEIHLIDYYETSGEGLNHYKKILQEKPYNYAQHWAPHDIEVRELGTGKSRRETARELGIDFQLAPNFPVDDGINAARMILPRCWFDQKKTKEGIEALKQYHKEWDDKARHFKDHPCHDWASHGADAFRYFAVSYQRDEIRDPRRQTRALTEYDPYSDNYEPVG